MQINYTNSSDVFTNLFHEFFSVEKENKLLIGTKQVFFLSLPVEKETKLLIGPKQFFSSHFAG